MAYAGPRTALGWPGVAVLCLAQFVDVLGVTVVITALPAMLEGLEAPASASTLVVAGYAMFFGGLLMLGSRLGDRYGHRRILEVGLVAFGAASLLAATSGTVTMLVLARCAQGAAAAASVPNALRLITGGTRDEHRRRAMAAWSATGAAAGASGFLLGGVLTDLAGWAAVFWVNVPLAVVLVLAVRATVSAGAGERSLGSLDLAGAALLTAGVMALVSGGSALEAHRQLPGLGLLTGGAALLVALVHVERRADRPLLPAEAVRDPNLRLGVVVALLNTATTSSMMTLATLHLQQTEGVSASAAGVRFLPFSICVVAGSSLAAPLLRHRGPRVGAVVGLLLVAAGDAILLALPIGDWILLAGVSVAGLGIGLASVASNTLGTDVPVAIQGTASGALNTAAQLGHALGVAAFLLLATSTRGSGFPLAGNPLAWGAAALTAGICALVIARPSRRVTRR